MSTNFKVTASKYEGADEMGVRWGARGTKYALVHLASEGGQVRPAGERALLTPLDIFKHPRSLVIGERSGGGRSFLSWLMDGLGSTTHWIAARGYRWEAEHFRFSDAMMGDDQKAQRERARDCLMKFSKGTAAQRSQHLIQWARSLKGSRPVHVLIRDLGGLGEKSSEEAAVALRLFGEGLNQEPKAQDMLRLLLVSTSENRFEDRYDASGFAIMCERYRLPWLVPEEIAGLARNAGFARAQDGKPLHLGDDALDEILQISGGQPLLVQEVLARLCRGGDAKPGKGDIRKRYRLLRAHPPEAVRWWKADLESRLDGSPSLREALRDYVGGTTRGGEELPRLHHSLMYPGWIRFDRAIERWKISSKIHRHLALEVLSQGGR